jgi:L-fucose mutarotase
VLMRVSPIISAELLSAIYRMGHTQEIAFLDANCPIPIGHDSVIHATGLPLIDLLSAVLELMPIDHIGHDAVCRSCVDDTPSIIAPVYEEVQSLCDRSIPGLILHPLQNEAFNKRLGLAHTVVSTGERRLYANIILRKGILDSMNG